MKVVGIDPGKKGGIGLCVLGRIERLEVMPSDYTGLAALLSDWQPDIIYLEKQWARPGNAAKSTFTSAEGYGTIIGILIALKIPYVLVAPTKWCAAMHKGANRGTKANKTNAKQRSKEMALSLFPYMNFLATSRSKIKHDGLIDASLISLYGYRCEKGIISASSR